MNGIWLSYLGVENHGMFHLLEVSNCLFHLVIMKMSVGCTVADLLNLHLDVVD